MSNKIKKGSLTNEQLVSRFMNINPAGALGQCFLIEAVTKYADAVLADEAETRKQMEHSFIHPEGWIAAAKEWRRVTNENYGWSQEKPKA